MSLETVRVSERAKQQLVKLKRKTSIDNWNVLCRWAFCFSLTEKSVPPDENIVTDSNVEMTWKTFGGKDENVYLALLKQRCYQDGLKLDEDTLSKYFKLHLHRGISYLANSRKIESITDLVSLALS
jgi:DNA sulfur modification protein DndE